MEVSTWSGTLTLDEFTVAANAFADKWKRSNSSFPPWLWVNNTPKPPFLGSTRMDVYLSLENICLHDLDNKNDKNYNCDEGSCIKEEEASFSRKEEAIDGEDDATLVHSNNQLHYYDFHIVYSASYRVPVFYFRGYCSDGSLLQLNQIEKDLPTCSAKVLLESKWTFITQEEHPYLNRPWYKLHPCGTSEWMKLLFMGDAASIEKRVPFELYLISWFSVVGQVFSFRIPVAMVNHATVTDG
ncbi:ubiquitin-like-conjugating enzyme ATG10 isoform X5 [Mercurialis annua]|uniref:ubiquitin-like-conjugating enzyme ATG10 isoform X5 n=1 Tax=Mercurialis annua TaxID=3986 RepID=UPI00215F13A9|nr:ubiquitin-like-conjugating enzyme ATG10 isoform X5 [Mercurialis annua]